LCIFSYAITADADAAEPTSVMFMMFGMLSFIYLMWVTVPLSLSGGNQFNPERLLLYPIGMRKLFAIDFVSELTSLASIFALPCLLGIAVGAGLGTGHLWKALLAGVCAGAFGIALAKLLAIAMGALVQRKRARGENMVALIGTVGGIASIAVSQLMMRERGFPDELRWTPPGAIAVALAEGASADGASRYWAALATLMVYTIASVALAYRIARHSVLGRGSVKRRAVRISIKGSAGARHWGWQLPWLSPEVSAIVEKELRYAWRNAQLRTVVVMPLLFTFWFRFMQPDGAGSRRSFFQDVEPFAEGSWTALGVLYVFMFTSSISSNIFGFDGAGMRALVLAPVERKLILTGKNIAMTFISFLVAVGTMLVNCVVFRDLSLQGLVFTVLCFVFFASVFALTGNWLSMLFPKRLQIGKKMNASGVAGVLLILICIGAALPPAAAVAAGYFARSLILEYVILTTLAGVGLGLYLLLIEKQGQVLAKRELDILEAVSGRSDD
ncbi:MAG: hypothetical protein H0T92_16430, partial [Pyrinomonadaceae bacterium]|nr:hypothetical protein [Pyrinomonadaceae bacterium]